MYSPAGYKLLKPMVTYYMHAYVCLHMYASSNIHFSNNKSCLNIYVSRVITQHGGWSWRRLPISGRPLIRVKREKRKKKHPGHTSPAQPAVTLKCQVYPRTPGRLPRDLHAPPGGITYLTSQTYLHISA